MPKEQTPADERRARRAELVQRGNEIREAMADGQDATAYVDEMREIVREINQIDLESRGERMSALRDLVGDTRNSEGGQDTFGEMPGRVTRSLPAHASAARSAALRGIEHISGDLDNRAAKRLESLVEESIDTPSAFDARRLAAVADPNYRSAFGKLIFGDQATAHLRMSPAELEALQRANTPEFRSFTTTQSGYAVPAQIDPTVLNISNGALNPFRQMARVVTITSETWKGITSAGITASYDAEAAEVSDDTPTLAQPSISVDKAQSLVTFSIESGEDWQGLQAEMAREFADAKDVLEESKFTSGAGHGSNEPQGIITGASVTFTTLATSVAPALADLYTTTDALPARWLADAEWLTTPRFLGKVQQLAIAAGAGGMTSFGDLAAGPARNLIGYPVNRGTTIDSAWQTAGKKIAVFGSFKRAFVIVDRVGMSVELVPHIFNTANNLPDGRRGLYMHWRNSSGVLSTSAFVVLKSS